MEKELTERLFPIAISVVEKKYPDMKKLRPFHFEGVVTILVREFKDYASTRIGSDEHVRDMMETNLKVLKESLE